MRSNRVLQDGRMPLKIVIATAFVGIFILGIGLYFGTSYQGGRLTTDSDINEQNQNPDSIPNIEDEVSDNSDTPEPPGSSPKPPATPPSDTSPVISSFEECVVTGNLVMESYPRQCVSNGTTFVEEIETTTPSPQTPQSKNISCTAEQKKAEICTLEYAPVCGLVEVQCITTPCDPIPQTFGNVCSACAQQNVVSYSRGECEL